MLLTGPQTALTIAEEVHRRLKMQVPGDTAVETGVCLFNDPEHAGKRDEEMWFLVWMAVWAVALAALLPALI